MIKLTTNKNLYSGLIKQDTFSDRLIFFLLHFAFFLKAYKNEKNSKILQEIYDFNFRQLELSIREIGYGDASINKKMKNYVNVFYSILSKIENWENLDRTGQNQIIENYLNINNDSLIFPQYFNRYINYLKKNTFNSLLKGVIKPNF